MPDRVRITDVAARDGLQNEEGRVATERKAELVAAIDRSGVDEVEITSFVSPKWIPQLGDAAELCELLARSKPDNVVYSALVPNEQGMERLLDVNDHARAAHGVNRLIDKVSVFTAASETFSEKNTNATIAETIERFVPVADLARDNGLDLAVYISCAFACPFEGPTPPNRVSKVCHQLNAVLPEDWIDHNDQGEPFYLIGDTIGAAKPEAVLRLVEHLSARSDLVEPSTIGLHLHDTFGNAAACVRAGLEAGVRAFDGAVGGLGGCPYASTPEKRAPGNLSTSVLVRSVHEAGFETGVRRDSLSNAETIAAAIVSESRAGASS
ncbi:MAG: hydroxymethylglutaryl-CoA lyase [Planctomycetota bacterium]